ncbi:MAG: hypothetical protein A3G25_11135 [Betaproteobacteria bacterium RIFCSPLOWO2_12_FULL_63_13]|nr:MAG: hypothetical protein A3G25_11135 [Betaproteobacteria bacterium RIFCSPLOWO2_12_FULL_63_13]
MVPVERQGRPTIIPNWIVLIEGVSLEAVSGVGDVELADPVLRQHRCADSIERDTYNLQIMVLRRR